VTRLRDDQLFSSAGDVPRGTANIYGILHEGEAYVEAVEANLSLGLVKREFLSNLARERLRGVSPALRPHIERELQSRKRAVQDDKGYWRIVETDPIVALHGLYDDGDRALHLVGLPSDSPSLQSGPTGELLQVMLGWLAKRYGHEAGEISYGAGPVPYLDYEVCMLTEIPGIFDTAKRLGILLDPDWGLADAEKKMAMFPTSVLMVNYRNLDIRREIESQLGSKEDAFVSDKPFSLVQGDKVVMSLDATPFFVVNTTGRNWVSVARRLLQVMLERQFVAKMFRAEASDQYAEGQVQSDLVRGQAKIDIDIGRDPANVMGELMQADWKAPRTAQTEKAVAKYGVEPESAGAELVRKFILLAKMPDFGKRDRLFYYVARRPAGAQLLHEDLFAQFFVTMKAVSAGEKELVLLGAYYHFPEKVFAVFGFEGVSTEKTLDVQSKVLSQSVYEADLVRRMKNPDASYLSKKQELDGEIVGQATKFLGLSDPNELRNAMESPVLIKPLSAFPFAYSEVRAEFELEGLAYQDIDVILVVDSQKPGVTGGYVRADAAKPGFSSQFDIFRPPFIMLNVFNHALRDEEVLTKTLVHEGTHYRDDLLVRAGKADQSMMYSPQQQGQSLEDLLYYLNEYLSKSPTEVRAWSAESAFGLKAMDVKKLERGRAFYKKKMLADHLGQELQSLSLVADAKAGSDKVMVSSDDMRYMTAEAADIVDGTGGPDQYYEYGTKNFDTVRIVGTSPEGELTVSPALHRDYLVRNDAAVICPPLEQPEMRWEKEKLYSAIIDKAFDSVIEASRQAKPASGA